MQSINAFIYANNAEVQIYLLAKYLWYLLICIYVPDAMQLVCCPTLCPSQMCASFQLLFLVHFNTMCACE